jgi:hypothetical protein
MDKEVKERIGFEVCANFEWIARNNLYTDFAKTFGRDSLKSMAIQKVKINCPTYKKKEQYTTKW